MSNRIKERNKAVKLAWDIEQDLIKEGKGTRDWTPEQQKDILETGKAHDDEGFAFAGHHMKSVASYPEYAGNPENIQFLSPDEHRFVHSNYGQTNGFYDPITGQMHEFDISTLPPRKIIDLSSPIIQIEGDSNANRERQDQNLYENETKAPSHEVEKTGGEQDLEQQNTSPSAFSNSTSPLPKSKALKAKAGQVFKQIKPYAKPVGRFLVNYGVPFAIEYGIPLLNSVAGKKMAGGKGMKVSTKVSTPSTTSVKMSASASPASHASPVEHIVKGHQQRYNGKWVTKAPYTRGGKK